MIFEGLFQHRLETLHREGRYRVFAVLKRRRWFFPITDHLGANGAREITVSCSNDHLAMATTPRVLTAMHGRNGRTRGAATVTMATKKQ